MDNLAFAAMPLPQQRVRLRCYLRSISALINTKLPTRIEYTMIVEQTNVEGLTLVYHFRADVSRADVKPGAMDSWKPTVRAQICADPSKREIISLGGSYRYVWRDRVGKYIDKLTVRDCSK